MSFFNRFKNPTSKGKQPAAPPTYAPPSGPPPPPPAWEPAPERSHTLGLFNEASDDDCQAAIAFCEQYPAEAPKLLSSDVVERIQAEGCRAWSLVWPTGRSSRFVGRVQATGEKGGASVVKVITEEKCRETCLMSDLPVMAGLYDVQGKSGIYYEVVVHRMDGIIALGTSFIAHTPHHVLILDS